MWPKAAPEELENLPRVGEGQGTESAEPCSPAVLGVCAGRSSPDTGKEDSAPRRQAVHAAQGVFPLSGPRAPRETPSTFVMVSLPATRGSKTTSWNCQALPE